MSYLPRHSQPWESSGEVWGSFRVVFLLTLLPTFVASGQLVRQSLMPGGTQPEWTGKAL